MMERSSTRLWSQALEKLNFTKPTLVQEKVIPQALKGNSLVVESATGSGKTHSFLLPIFQNLDVDNKNVQVVILSPTRELASQLFNVTKELIIDKPEIDVRLIIGGGNRESEIKRLSQSQPQVVIGTLGRVSDLAIKANVLKMIIEDINIIKSLDFKSRNLNSPPFTDKCFCIIIAVQKKLMLINKCHKSKRY